MPTLRSALTFSLSSLGGQFNVGFPSTIWRTSLVAKLTGTELAGAADFIATQFPQQAASPLVGFRTITTVDGLQLPTAQRFAKPDWAGFLPTPPRWYWTDAEPTHQVLARRFLSTLYVSTRYTRTLRWRGRQPQSLKLVQAAIHSYSTRDPHSGRVDGTGWFHVITDRGVASRCSSASGDRFDMTRHRRNAVQFRHPTWHSDWRRP